MTSIERWVQSLSTEVSGSLAREELCGKEGLDEGEGLASLGHELRRNYISREEIALVLDSLGASRLADHLRENKLPTKVSIRHGEFGEA